MSTNSVEFLTNPLMTIDSQPVIHQEFNPSRSAAYLVAVHWGETQETENPQPKILLLKIGGNTKEWGLPGGGYEDEDSDVLDTVLREASAELQGYEELIAYLQPTVQYAFRAITPHFPELLLLGQTERTQYSEIFVTDVTGTSVDHNDEIELNGDNGEHTKAHWFTIAELEEMVQRGELQQVVLEVIRRALYITYEEPKINTIEDPLIDFSKTNNSSAICQTAHEMAQSLAAQVA